MFIVMFIVMWFNRGRDWKEVGLVTTCNCNEKVYLKRGLSVLQNV